MSLFPHIDEEVKEFEAKFKSHISKLKENKAQMRVSDMMIFENLHCAKCSKDNIDKDIFCDTLCSLGASGGADDIIEIGDEIICLKQDNVMKNLRIDFMKKERKCTS